MTRQTTAPIEGVSLNATNRMAFDLARQVGRGIIDLNPPYQRGAVWTDDQRIALVRSWMMGVPIPAIILNNRGNSGWYDAHGSSPYETSTGIYAVVDGKQRLETAVAWFNGDLAVPASWFAPDDVTETVETDDGPYVTFNGLAESRQSQFEFRSPLPCAEGQLATVRAEAEVYLLVNGGGTPQSDDDMARAARIADTKE